MARRARSKPAFRFRGAPKPEKEKGKMAPSKLEETLARQLAESPDIPAPVREVRFLDSRRWRFDFAWPDVKLACEVEGGVYSGGRHTSGAGFEKDCEKYNTALVLGWRVLRVTAKHVRDFLALEWIEQALGITRPALAEAS
jgi:very-short-patch-repair endonuclease